MMHFNNYLKHVKKIFFTYNLNFLINIGNAELVNYDVGKKF